MRSFIFRHRNAVYLAALISISVGLWLPRLRGPLDLRWDAGVYYILGTSLAQGNGYRLLSEPGEIQAIQYPPLLPLFAAACQRLAGTVDPAVVGHWLRISFFVIFLLLIASVYRLSGYFLMPGLAFLATLVTLLHAQTTWMSELFFAELPFACTSVLFLLVARNKTGPSREWFLGTLGAACFLLRSAGIILLAAWVGESLIKRRLGQMALRATLALVPILAWQAYIGHVKAGPEYIRLAYEYQRAGYQFNNVGYLENLAYIDPFAPELGRVSTEAVVKRAVSNAVGMPVTLGAAVSVGPNGLRNGIKRVNRRLEILQVPLWFAKIPIGALGTLVLLGLVVLAIRGEWLIVIYIIGSASLICLTPWPDQFDRYIWPLTPMLAFALFVALILVRERLFAAMRGRRVTGVTLIATVVLGVLIVQSVSLVKIYRGRNTAFFKGEWGKRREYRLFYYPPAWQLHDGALDWLAERAGPHEIIATSTPHWAYWKTGLTAVLPPFEPDVRKAAQLIDLIPVKYLLIDCNGPLIPSAESSIAAGRPGVDLTRKYTLPVITAFPERWELIYSTAEGSSRIYQRVSPKD